MITSASGSNMTIYGASVTLGLSNTNIAGGQLTSAKIVSMNCSAHATSFSDLGNVGKAISLKSDTLQDGVVQTKSFGPIKLHQETSGLFSTEVGKNFEGPLKKFCQ